MGAARKRIIGLTGNIGAGKSTVIAWLAEQGAFVLDADRLGHAVMAPGLPAYDAVLAAFGPQVLATDGSIDRRALGAIVFADPAQLARLEAIIHPAVLARAEALIADAAAPIVVIEAIKLLEARNLLRLCDEIWVVIADEELVLRRLMESRGMREDDARRRLAAQSSQAEKLRHATRVITNNGTAAELYAQLAQIWAELTEQSHTLG